MTRKVPKTAWLMILSLAVLCGCEAENKTHCYWTCTFCLHALTDRKPTEGRPGIECPKCKGDKWRLCRWSSEGVPFHYVDNIHDDIR